MSMELMASSERVCYVHCNLCNTILAVSVPSLNSLQRTAATVVTVRCGHCSNLLSVNIGAASLQYYSLPSPPSPAPPPPTPPNHPIHFHSHPNLHSHQKQHQVSSEDSSSNKDYGSSSSSSTSSKYTKFLSPSAFDLQSSTIATVEQPRLSPIPPPEKRQRVPSAYNKFIKEEIQRIKASNPDISHREAFSTAAKNWAHFPHIHFGLKLESNKQAKLDHQAFAGEQGTQKSTNGLY